MKKFTADVISILLAMSLVSCGSGDEVGGENAVTEPVTTADTTTTTARTTTTTTTTVTTTAPPETTKEAADEVSADYDNADSFEAALIDGKDTMGKTVQFVVSKKSFEQLLGYSLWAGEDVCFNFMSRPDAEVGDEVTVRVCKIGQDDYGVWVITCELAEEEESDDEVEVDYGSAEAFEAALNDGKNLEGKVVQYVVSEPHPDQIIGYNLWAGDHLNFYYANDPDAKAGDTVTARAYKIGQDEKGSWFICCKPVKNAVVTDDTITDYGQGNSGGGETLVDGMRPSFKEALDSYEAFFDEYIAFMQRYMENPLDMSLLAEYTEFMTQYEDTMSKMDALDDGTLNDAEMAYYLEVTARITQKLLAVAM